MQKGYALSTCYKYSYPMRYRFFTSLEDAQAEEKKARDHDVEHPDYRHVHISVEPAILVEGQIYVLPKGDYEITE